MELNGKGSLLRVERECEGVAVEIKGNGKEILANWAILAHEVCDRLHMQPIMLAAMLPGMMASVRQDMAGRVSVDLEAMRKAKEGHNGAGK